jgi:putative membrane protein insertion efficiency factor
MRFLVLKIIRVYQKYLSPLLGPSCRFHPTCSEYALQAVETYGVFRGGILAAKRVLRCNPWGGSGVDPLPKDK